MNNRYKRALLAFAILVLLMVNGCVGYGKFVFESNYSGYYDNSSKMTIKKLIDNRMDYHVSYSGLSSQQAYGIMFDMKKDDYVLRGDSWIEIKDEEIFSSLVLWNIEPYELGRLYKIIGPDENLFGYMYIPNPNRNITAKIVDDKSLYVYRPTRYNLHGVESYFNQ